jgi:hypothetical protein
MAEKMTNEALTKANTIFNQMKEKICYLYDRWQDENEYEDFNEYKDVAKKHAESFGVIFVGMTKSPFAVKIQIDEYKIALFVTRKTYYWKRYA